MCDPSVTAPLEAVMMTPPTIAMSFSANDGPLAGRSGGTFLNSNQVKSRLRKEVENNVTLLLKQSATDSDQIEVHARGELQLGILIEEMRREGFELCVSPPRILTVTAGHHSTRGGTRGSTHARSSSSSHSKSLRDSNIFCPLVAPTHRDF